MNALKDIYFYNAMGLANELRQGSVSEYRAVKHLAAAVILGGISFEIPITVGFEKSNIGLFGLVVSILLYIVAGVISYYGVWLTYQVNNKGDGKDFFLRFSTLTLPVGIQLVVLFFWVGVILIFLAYALASALGSAGTIITAIAFFIAMLSFLLLFFIRMRNCIAIASGADK